MDRSGLMIALATALLFLANIGFSEVSYFHPLQIIALNLLGLASAILFFLAYGQRNRKISLKFNKYILLAILLFFLLIAFQMVWVAVVITTVALYAIMLISDKIKDYRFYAIVAIVILLTSALAYLSVSGLRNSNWKGIDEIAYNYFASYLLLHGANPYTVSMLPILSAHNITPTYLLNGTVETAYDYPAMSFLPVLFLGLFTLHNFLVFIAIVAFITTIVAFILFKDSDYNLLALVPIAAWLLATYLFIGTINHYMAVSLFLLVAYIKRKNIPLASVFLGLSASTIQLSWFAIPFFFILTLREHGKTAMLKSVIISLLVFFVINGYFIIIGPSVFFKDIFGLFGASKLLLAGTNITQVLVRSYGVPSWYPAIVSVIVLLSSMVLFYLYTSTLKPFLAVVPAFIFMLSWHNFLMYSLAFVPLVIALCYGKEDKGLKDIIKPKRYIAIVFALLVLFSAGLAIYAHSIYLKGNIIAINGINPVIRPLPNGTGYTLNSIAITVTNNAGHYENVSFFLINSRPVKDAIFLSSGLKNMPPHSTEAYTLDYRVSGITNSTSIYIMAFSTDYIRSAVFNIDVKNMVPG